MQTLDWNTISDKDKRRLKDKKKLTFLAGPIQMSQWRIRELISAYSPLVFGSLKDEEIPGLEGSLQFQPLKESFLLQVLKRKVLRTQRLTFLKHFHKDTKYIIRELKPKKVLFMNGSWKGQIHYTSMYWEAVNRNIPVTLLSPFCSEQEAKRFERKMSIDITTFNKKMKKYSDSELLHIARKVRNASWDWIGQVGAVLAKNGKILSVGFNRVLPYQAYQMHFGSLREKIFTPAQEMIETQMTNHAECEILEDVRRRKITLKGSTLYINLFPCPVCAKMLARSEISGIVYREDHNLGNDFGYKVLELSGKNIRRIVN
jgi:deoxycytidylate deaminase